jgi:hypothetical protein
MDNEACGDVQSAAIYKDKILNSTAVEISFLFRSDNIHGLEAYALGNNILLFFLY